MFLDINQAFDTVWHHGLLLKLNKLGISGNMAKFLEGFLKLRKISVKLQNIISPCYPLHAGVPQGSVLSPTLFTIFINDIFKDLPKEIKTSLFADDGALWVTSTDLQEALIIMQRALNMITSWSQTWGLKISPSKTNAVIFTLRRTNQPLPLKINEININYLNVTKFLGINFDSKLIWDHHIKELQTRCKKDIQLLRVISYNKIADYTTMKTLYTALIRPKIDYGSFLYSNASKGHLEKLDRIQIGALKVCLGAIRCTPNFKIEVECDIEPLKYRREEILTNYGCRVGTIGDHPVSEFIKKYSPTHHLYETKFNLSSLERLQENLKSIPQTPLPKIDMELKYNTDSLPIYSTLAETPKDKRSEQQWKALYQYLVKERYPSRELVFTDGSKQLNRCGFGVWSRHFQLLSRLPSACTIFSAELYALYKAISLVSTLPGNYLIMTDSLSVIRSLVPTKYKF